MDKISFFELFSFIIPGLFTVYFWDNYFQNVYHFDLIKMQEGNLLESLIFFTIILFIGIFLNIWASILRKNSFLEKFNIYKTIKEKYTDKPLCEIVKNDVTLLNAVKEIGKNYQNNLGIKEEPTYEQVFTYSYNLLEVEQKNHSFIVYHSFYNTFRFLISLIYLLIPLVALSAVINRLWLSQYSVDKALIYLLALVICFLMLLRPTQWLRNMFIHKLFKNMHAYIINQNHKS